MHRTVVVGTGSHIPSVVVPNDYFLQHEFHGPDNKPIGKSNAEILKQFEAITGIRERRYVPDDLVTSDIASTPRATHCNRRASTASSSTTSSSRTTSAM